MSQDNISRPQAEKRKIHSKNEFELCYLRHQYIRKTDSNPSLEDMKPYMSIASHMAKNTYFTYRNLFGMVGFECDDVVSIANIHLVSFLGLFSLEKMPDKYEDFVNTYHSKNFKNPNESAKLDKNRANCTLFLKQRMEDLVRICRQKARNIKGFPTEEFAFYHGVQEPPAILRELLSNNERHGYKKMDSATYKSIKKKAGNIDGPVFKFSDVYYVAVRSEQKTLTVADFSGADLDPYDNIHNMSPDQTLAIAQSIAYWEQKSEEFYSKNDSRKSIIVKNFINKNKKNPKFKQEVETARKLLERFGA